MAKLRRGNWKGIKKHPRHWVACACGCGIMMADRDEGGRLRRYIHGHRVGQVWRAAPDVQKRKMTVSEQARARWADPDYRARTLQHSFENLPRGEKASGWIDGSSFYPYTKEFNTILKRKIRDRDGHRCRRCGKPESENPYRLAVHHIDYDKHHSVEDNLISLCHTCSSLANWNRPYWTAMFKALLAHQLLPIPIPIRVWVMGEGSSHVLSHDKE